MADQTQKEYQQDPAGSNPSPHGGTFKREGPDPAPGDTGSNVREMNDKAGESVVNNVTPDQTPD